MAKVPAAKAKAAAKPTVAKLQAAAKQKAKAVVVKDKAAAKAVVLKDKAAAKAVVAKQAAAAQIVVKKVAAAAKAVLLKTEAAAKAAVVKKAASKPKAKKAPAVSTARAAAKPVAAKKAPAANEAAAQPAAGKKKAAAEAAASKPAAKQLGAPPIFVAPPDDAVDRMTGDEYVAALKACCDFRYAWEVAAEALLKKAPTAADLVASQAEQAAGIAAAKRFSAARIKASRETKQFWPGAFWSTVTAAERYRKPRCPCCTARAPGGGGDGDPWPGGDGDGGWNCPCGNARGLSLGCVAEDEDLADPYHPTFAVADDIESFLDASMEAFYASSDRSHVCLSWHQHDFMVQNIPLVSVKLDDVEDARKRVAAWALMLQSESDMPFGFMGVVLDVRTRADACLWCVRGNATLRGCAEPREPWSPAAEEDAQGRRRPTLKESKLGKHGRRRRRPYR